MASLRGPRCQSESTLQHMDMAQRSGAPGAQSLHSDLVAVAAGVQIHIKLHPTSDGEGPYTLPDLLGAPEELTGEVPGPYQPYWNERQVVHQGTFLPRRVGFELATLALKVGGGMSSAALCREGLDHAVQSRVQPVAWPISWQQFTSTPFRSVLPPKLAVWASPLCLCQLWFTAVVVWVRECDLR